MKIVNSWKAKNKQNDKGQLILRIGKLTLFELSFDLSDKKVRLILLNVGLQND